MTISVLIPHFRTAKMTTYCVAQFLKFKGNHDLKIIISNNSPGDGSIEYLLPFKDQIQIVDHPADIMHSHGTSLDRLIPLINTEWFITAETDSFPTEDGFLDLYEDLINQGVDCAGSRLSLSGGSYIHPAGALYKKSNWEEAKKFCDGIPYYYFPNMSLRESFACHLMVHKSVVDKFLYNPDDYIELADGYKPYSIELAQKKQLDYLPVVGPMHNGMGNRQESVRTYGNRTIESETATVICDGKQKLIHRIGAEPGQWFSWWHAAMGKKIWGIGTETKWLPGKENQQQEYTKMINGFVHLWGVTAYHSFDGGDAEITQIKRSTPEELYNSLPNYQKI